ncbi:MAG TPA: PfkB family carbohydrate kinase [bacterium]|jgi:sugar/nucleoside kinase (ribokinase family)|nr:PfkB family carbohydrate kinase [bacterium]
MSEVLIVGSVAYDGLKTPYGSADRVLGGAATYSSLAASLFAPVKMVGVVGNDFKASDMAMLKRHGINTDLVTHEKGKTFYWKGYYENDMGVAHTVKIDLGVFERFDPEITGPSQRIPFVFLAAIHPDLQMKVLNQMIKPKFVVLDTRDLWINITKPALLKVLRKTDLVVVNDQEVRLLTGEMHLMKGARALQKMGPKTVIVKKGEHGAMLFGPGGTFLSPAVPLDYVVDPTGAGDTFAGAFIGYLARAGKVTPELLKQAVIMGNLVASFTVQGFGTKTIAALNRAKLQKRAADYHRFASIPQVKI